MGLMGAQRDPASTYLINGSHETYHFCPIKHSYPEYLFHKGKIKGHLFL